MKVSVTVTITVMMTVNDSDGCIHGSINLRDIEQVVMIMEMMEAMKHGSSGGGRGGGDVMVMRWW